MPIVPPTSTGCPVNFCKEGGEEGGGGVTKRRMKAGQRAGGQAAAASNLIVHGNERVVGREGARCSFAVDKQLLHAAPHQVLLHLPKRLPKE